MKAKTLQTICPIPLITILLTACSGSGSTAGMDSAAEPIMLSGPLSLAAVSSDAVTQGTTSVSDTLADFPAAASTDFAGRFPAFSADERSRTINYAGSTIVSDNWGIEAERDDDSTEVAAQYSTEGNFLSSQIITELAELPVAIAAVIGQMYPDATIDESAQITDANRNMSYQVELETADSELDILLDSSGNVISTAEEVDQLDVPASILTNVSQAIAGAEAVEFERITRGDGSTVYQAELEGDNESVSITYSASGEVLSMEYEAD